MKILIVDDEELTRTGLIQSIDWTSLGIRTVLCADDGLNGWQMFKKELPDIVLTDVRMPRMDGIQMSKKIHQLNPDCPIIFMSGYSDKEYLKAAIRLRAVRYVEKPINAKEVAEAVQEAVLAVSQKRLHSQSQALFQKEASSQLALKLTKPDFVLSPELSSDILEFPIHSSAWFSTLIIKFSRHLSEFLETDLSRLLNELETLSGARGFHQIHTLKQEEFLILHLFGSERPSKYALEHLCKDICAKLAACKQFYIVVGKPVSGPEKVYQSYRSAVILLQNAFFYPYGSILLSDEVPQKQPAPQLMQLSDEFLQLLLNKDTSAANELSRQLYLQLVHSRTLLVNQAKDIYYRLLTHLSNAAYQLKLSGSYLSSAAYHLKDMIQPDTDSPMELVTKCSNLDELNVLLTKKLTDFDRLLAASPTENSTVFLIRDYIGKHYMDDQLSIKDISEHVHLSSSYLCTIFKTETGQTLNQYITEFRIEKAKQLLSDPRNKISEISVKVGYADGNYFGKSFKKAVGLSPSEYREKELLL